MKTQITHSLESEIVQRVKSERKNKGKMYWEYLTPRQRLMFKKGTHIGTI